MKLFVDDMRACPEGWILARTITEAIRLINTGYVEEVSLDHDIACRLWRGQEHTSNETFEPVAIFLKHYNDTLEENRCDPIKVRIHTANFDAGSKMAGILGIEYNSYLYDPEDYA